jgi:cell division protein FtsI (penicillin-binding protein 3)
VSRAPRTDAGSFRLRAWFLLGVLLLGAGGLVARAVDLQLLDRGFLIKQGDARFTRTVSTGANRGTIVDRNGELLAISIPVDSAWADPRELGKFPDRWPELATVLQRDRGDLARRISSGHDSSFLWLARLITPDQARAVRKLEIPGVHLSREQRRYYPAGEVVSHVVGFTGVEDGGLEGVELVYDSTLAGEGGFKRVIQDRNGRRVEDVENIRAARPGRDLALSLDARIQYLAYREL